MRFSTVHVPFKGASKGSLKDSIRVALAPKYPIFFKAEVYTIWAHVPVENMMRSDLVGFGYKV